MAEPRRPQFTRDVLIVTLIAGAILEIAWTVFLGWRLPRHYEANHWDLAWVGLDSAQVAMLLCSAWAAWKRRAVLIMFASAAGTLLLVDAWFDTVTARYKDLEISGLFLILEIPWAVIFFWVAYRTFKILTAPIAGEDAPLYKVVLPSPADDGPP